MLLMLEGGGRHIEDLGEIQEDRALRQAIGLRRMTSLSTFGDWLVRRGRSGGVEAMGGSEEVAGEMGKRLAIPARRLRAINRYWVSLRRRVFA